jgi:hypothetical protein
MDILSEPMGMDHSLILITRWPGSKLKEQAQGTGDVAQHGYVGYSNATTATTQKFPQNHYHQHQQHLHHGYMSHMPAGYVAGPADATMQQWVINGQDTQPVQRPWVAPTSFDHSSQIYEKYKADKTFSTPFPIPQKESGTPGFYVNGNIQSRQPSRMGTGSIAQPILIEESPVRD